MKKVKVLMLSGVLSAMFISCKKESVLLPTDERSLVNVTHHYLYGDEEYNVVYEFDENDKLISSTGDIEERENLFSENKNSRKSVILVENVNRTGTDFRIRFFDSSDELNKYQGVEAPLVENNDLSELKYNPCYNNGWSGNASFQFYKHINYSDEIMNIRRLNHAFFQIHYLNHNENDQISSLKVSNGSVDLFEHGCFYGTQIRFLHSIPNLHYFTASSVYYSNDPVDYIGSRPSGFFPANYNFGDLASSIKGWSI